MSCATSATEFRTNLSPSHELSNIIPQNNAPSTGHSAQLLSTIRPTLLRRNWGPIPGAPMAWLRPISGEAGRCKRKPDRFRHEY